MTTIRQHPALLIEDVDSGDGTAFRRRPRSRRLDLKLECNIDDSTARCSALCSRPHSDRRSRRPFLPVFMKKKNRPATSLPSFAMTPTARRSSIVFAETTTIGIRRQRMERSVMDVSWRDVGLKLRHRAR